MESRVRVINRIGEFIGILDRKKRMAMDEIGRFCLDKMNYYVPVDTGFLQSKNDYKVSGFFNLKLTLMNDCYYAGFVEFGTVKMTAQPFMRPAFENHMGEIRAIARRIYSAA